MKSRSGSSVPFFPSQSRQARCADGTRPLHGCGAQEGSTTAASEPRPALLRFLCACDPVQSAECSEEVNPGQTDQEGYGVSPRASFYRLPMSLHAPGPLVALELLRPVPHNRPLPDGLTALLLPTPRPQQTVQETGARVVEVWCDLDQVSVRVDGFQLRAWNVPSLFRLGSCEASSASPRFLFFRFRLTECGGESKVGTHGFHYSYQVGFRPQVQHTTLIKSIRSKRSYSLTVCNAQGEPIPPGHWFFLGEPVYFVAQTGVLLAGERLYADACYATSSKDSCMADSNREGSSSRFLSEGGSVLKFSVDAFLFRAVLQVGGAGGHSLSMHLL
ncbi:uncharacterized protein LOC114557382 [Perca flavescens]|uniref:uncharacterized protein LOC114557382 n=1 Tax=Perca flavescens TaxID=8167 RepID=UPI00106DD691|nr:uncharacterized protein LOC114557382 [Perca flavescens]